MSTPNHTITQVHATIPLVGTSQNSITISTTPIFETQGSQAMKQPPNNTFNPFGSSSNVMSDSSSNPFAIGQKKSTNNPPKMQKLYISGTRL